MPAVHFTNLLVVVSVAFAAPLVFALYPRLRVPEIVLGIAIGPDALGWARADLPVSILALIGLAFLLFLAGLETDLARLRGRTMRLCGLAFVASFALALAIGGLLSATSLTGSPLFVAIVLSSTSLGVTFPVLKDSGLLRAAFGRLMVAAATVAEFGAFILLLVYSSMGGSTGVAARAVLLGAFAVVVVLVGLTIAGIERSRAVAAALVRLQDTTAQVRVRGAFVLLIGFVALARRVGLEAILGAFAAGAVLSVVDRDEMMTHPQFRVKLEAAGFGLFIPVFFVASGLTFDLRGLFASAGTVARVPLFLAALLVARGLPAALYVPALGRARAAVAALLQATSLPFIVVAGQIGMQLGVVSKTNAAAMMAAGLLSVVFFPPLALGLLRRGGPERERPASVTAPMPVLSAEDRALCRAQISSGSAITSTSDGPL